MPVEIKELIVKARIDDATTAASNGQVGIDTPTLTAREHQNIIEACVEAVLKILEDTKER